MAQPGNGLDKITAAAAADFAKTLASYEQQGATMLIEFAHEMNGNWYVWGQQPMQYIAAFQTMSTAIKKVRLPIAASGMLHESACIENSSC